MTGHVIPRARVLAGRIDAATPANRDRAVDALRALAIAGVILGHWLVTALVVTSGRTGHALHDESPLATMPYLTPVSWVFQTLAIFFLVVQRVTGPAAGHYQRGDQPVAEDDAGDGQRAERVHRTVPVRRGRGVDPGGKRAGPGDDVASHRVTPAGSPSAM